MTRTPPLVIASLILLALLVVSGVQPYDRPTWALEVFPVVIALPLLWATYTRFPLTTLVYVGIFLHALVLMLGGAYTYARVPWVSRSPISWTSAATLTTRSATSFRASCPPSSRAKFSCAGPLCKGSACSPSWWCASSWPSARPMS